MEKQLIVFSAPWCGPCKMYKPLLEDIKDDINTTFYNVDEDREMVEKFNVRGVPTTILIDEDGVTKTKVGSMSKGQLGAWLGL